MQDDDTRIELALLRQEVAAIKSREDRMRTEIDAWKAQDERRMRAAIIALGAAVLSMGAYIWAMVVGK
jgi:hypothetical protein